MKDMKRTTTLLALLALLCFVQCASGTENAAAGQNDAPASAELPAAPDTVATTEPSAPAGAVLPTEAALIVVSKESMTLAVYDFRSRLLAAWPIACGKALGNKEKPGDMKTPEGCFSVQQIQDARSWTHDFGDGKGEIRGAYGSHFIRLRTPGHGGIGIHGTHDPASIGTRATEGCIRLDNRDLLRLIAYIYVGMPVVILPSEADAAVPCRLPAAAKKGPELTPRDESATPAAAPELPAPTPSGTAETGPMTVSDTTSANPAEKPVPAKPSANKPAAPQSNPDRPAATKPVTEKSAPVQSAATASAAATQHHTVRSGESLSTIAERYGMTLSRLRELNPQVKKDRINVGQRLRVEPKK